MLVNHVFNPCCARTLVSIPTAGCMAVSVGLNRELTLLATFPRSFSCSPHSLRPAGHLPKVILSLSLPCWPSSQGHSLALSALLATVSRSFSRSLCSLYPKLFSSWCSGKGTVSMCVCVCVSVCVYMLLELDLKVL